MASGLAAALLDALPQTQCQRCGYADCRAYAEAMAAAEAPINRCPPGGAEGIARLAALSGRAVSALDPACGSEGPRRLAVIDESACIGCALCLKECPVDAIVGAAKQMHVVIAPLCTGCELCIPVCPVDCIDLVEASGGGTGWAAWSELEAAEARERYAEHLGRRQSPGRRPSVDDAAASAEPPAADQLIAAAFARARTRRGQV